MLSEWVNSANTRTVLIGARPQLIFWTLPTMLNTSIIFGNVATDVTVTSGVYLLFYLVHSGLALLYSVFRFGQMEVQHL